VLSLDGKFTTPFCFSEDSIVWSDNKHRFASFQVTATILIPPLQQSLNLEGFIHSLLSHFELFQTQQYVGGFKWPLANLERCVKLKPCCLYSCRLWIVPSPVAASLKTQTSVVAKVRIFGTSGQTMLSDSCTIIRMFVAKMMGTGTQNQYCIRLYFLVAPTHQFTTGKLTCHYYRCSVLWSNFRTPLQEPSATAL
jgi:hypothetical protein